MTFVGGQNTSLQKTKQKQKQRKKPTTELILPFSSLISLKVINILPNKSTAEF